MIQKGDIHRQLTYSSERVKTVLLHLQLLKEEFKAITYNGTIGLFIYT